MGILYELGDGAGKEGVDGERKREGEKKGGEMKCKEAKVK